MGRESKVINHREEEAKKRKRENKIRKEKGKETEGNTRNQS